LIVGDFELGLTVSIIIGAVPAVYIGARASSKAPDGVIRPALVFVLVASALKLLNLPTPLVGELLIAFVLIAFPIWGAFDAASHTPATWEAAGMERTAWIRWQAWLAPIGIGFGVAVAYFAKTRRKLVAVEPAAIAISTAPAPATGS
jgi:uncharacterized membrane protein YfcA